RRDADLDYSPNARHIVFVRAPSLHCCNQILVMHADGSRVRRIPGIGAIGDDANSPAYAPAGDRIVLAVVFGSYITATCSDLLTMSPNGTEAERVTNGCSPVGPGG